MDEPYDQSFTPWQTPLPDQKGNSYLKQPPQKRCTSLNRQFRQACFQKPKSKDLKHYFVSKSRGNSRNEEKTFQKTSQKQEFKKAHQTLHFQGFLTTKVSSFLADQLPNKEAFSTIINFAKKRRSIKQKIEKTKKLLQQNQKNKFKQKACPEHSKDQKQLQSCLERFLSLNKTSSNFTLSQFSNASINSSSSPTLDCFFQTKKTFNTNSRSLNISQHKDFQSNSQIHPKGKMNFMQSKTNFIYLKKRGPNKTFYKSGKYEKSMNLPKIQILDWQKPVL